MTPVLAVLLAASFPFRGAIRDNSGGEIPGLTTQTIDLRLYASLSEADAIWGRRFTVDVQPNGLFAIEVSDDGGAPLPSGTGIVTKDQTLDQALASVGSDPIYVGMVFVGRGDTEVKPRARLMPVPSAKLAMEADEAAGEFKMPNGLTLTKDASATGDFVVNGEASVLQVNGTGTLDVGGDASAGGVIVNGGTLSVARQMRMTDVSVKRISAAKVTAAATRAKTVSAGSVEIASGVGFERYAPKGMVIMWYGDLSEMPSGWELCDGGHSNGIDKPDLRDRFVVGASRDPGGEGKLYGVGAVGGAETVALEERHLPRHSHKIRNNQVGRCAYYLYRGSHTYTYQTQAQRGDDKNLDFASAQTDAAGNSEPHPNLPPYRGVYFLIKVR